MFCMDHSMAKSSLILHEWLIHMQCTYFNSGSCGVGGAYECVYSWVLIVSSAGSIYPVVVCILSMFLLKVMVCQVNNPEPILSTKSTNNTNIRLIIVLWFPKMKKNVLGQLLSLGSFHLFCWTLLFSINIYEWAELLLVFFKKENVNWTNNL